MKNLVLFENFEVSEDTSATGGAPSAGMGAVISSQPSSLAGTTIGPNWSNTGGTEGSGDVSVAYNASGGNMMSQKVPVMGFNHGAMTGKKSRVKKLDIKALRNALKNKDTKGTKKVMSFDDFEKSDIEKIKK